MGVTVVWIVKAMAQTPARFPKSQVNNFNLGNSILVT
jgi:hypothetical protein